MAMGSVFKYRVVLLLKYFSTVLLQLSYFRFWASLTIHLLYRLINKINSKITTSNTMAPIRITLHGKTQKQVVAVVCWSLAEPKVKLRLALYRPKAKFLHSLPNSFQKLVQALPVVSLTCPFSQTASNFLICSGRAAPLLGLTSSVAAVLPKVLVIVMVPVGRR